ncbi:MAG: hypothetical protein WB762_24450 [Candidatus Sulfotelmatobacter sp.]
MKTLILIACGVMVAVFGGASPRTGVGLADWAEQAISPDQAVARQSSERLREAGPQGLQALEQRFAKEIQLHRSGAPSNERWEKISLALNRVGGQYDNYASGLYWYTDLEKAKAAARASGRPILSLRLLGRLDEDLSCANSRFFRTTLYPSIEINQLLKQRFILHWQSVRPAPRVTITFGDGRKLERTITGNSIHYILDAEGRVVDALPGLYSAPVFAAELRQAADATQQAGNHENHDYTDHMKSTQERLLHEWAADLSALHVAFPATKSMTEAELERLMDDNRWHQVAQLQVIHGFDAGVRELMARKLPSAVESPLLQAQPRVSQVSSWGHVPPSTEPAFPDATLAATRATSKSAVEMPMLRAFTTFNKSVSLDTVKNNYMLRAKILAFLAASSTERWSLDRINDWVYAQVFLTPRQDPWLGLASQNVFTAIDGNGENR